RTNLPFKSTDAPISTGHGTPAAAAIREGKQRRRHVRPRSCRPCRRSPASCGESSCRVAALPTARGEHRHRQQQQQLQQQQQQDLRQHSRRHQRRNVSGTRSS
ncbi:unnamed protein product, partial [Ectocarpus sp. 12 AP-2014]